MADATVKVRLFATLRKKYGVKELMVKCNGTLPEYRKRLEDHWRGIPQRNLR